MKTILPLILLNWNGADDTIECLESLDKQTSKQFHIYLIDNNSDEEDKVKLDKALQARKNISYIQNPKNIGFAGAHNKIIQEHFLQSEHDFILLLNNDTTVESDFIEQLQKRLQHDPDVGMISCKMINYYKRDLVNNLGHKFLNTGEILPIACDEKERNYNEPFLNAGASGGAAVYSMKMLREIGLFDDYFITGYEDAEFGLRALICGYKLLYLPEARVYHKVGASIDKVRDYDFTMKIQLDILYTYFKLMPLGVIICNAPFYLVRSLILLSLFLVSLRFEYFSIFFKGWKLFVKRDYAKAKRARNILKPKISLSGFEILKCQEFFLRDNIKRFWVYFIKGKKTIFEVYK